MYNLMGKKRQRANQAVLDLIDSPNAWTPEIEDACRHPHAPRTY